MEGRLLSESNRELQCASGSEMWARIRQRGEWKVERFLSRLWMDKNVKLHLVKSSKYTWGGNLKVSEKGRVRFCLTRTIFESVLQPEKRSKPIDNWFVQLESDMF